MDRGLRRATPPGVDFCRWAQGFAREICYAVGAILEIDTLCFSQFESEPMNIHTSTLGLDFERIVRDAIQAHQPVADTGVAVAVLRYGQLAYAGGFGFRNRETREPVDVDTLFAIGSATKAFTSTVLSILAGTGAFSLDEPICQIGHSFKT